MSFTPGDIVGNYRVEALVHRGSYTARYRVRHVELETYHCLVVMTRRSKMLARRQLLAGRLQARLRHDNLVGATDLVRLDKAPALVLDWVNGALLSEHLQVHDRLSVEEADGLAAGLLRGLDHIHRNGVVHRNVKTSGIALEPDNNQFVPKLTDLALARVFGTEDPTSGSLRRGMLGTINYMAPEQSHFPDAVDERADLWSAGVTLYQALTGMLPFVGDDNDKILQAIRTGTYTPIKEVIPDLPDRIAKAITHSLQVKPHHRVGSARDMLREWTGGRRRVAAFKVPAAPSGTVTIVFTDVQDSTKLWDRDPEMMRRVLTAHDAIMRSAIARRGGYEVKTEGDAFMVAFSDPNDALHWCVDVQLALYEHPWPPEVQELLGTLLVRMGLHTGEPDCRPHPTTGAMDYFGPMVNRAARISSAGYGGQILASEASVRRLKLTDGLTLSRLGRFQLKGLSDPEELHEVKIPQLPRDHPPPKASRATMHP